MVSQGNCIQIISSEEQGNFCQVEKKKPTTHSKIDSRQTCKIQTPVCSGFPHSNLKRSTGRAQNNFPPYCTESNLSTPAFNWTHVIEDCAFSISGQFSFPPTLRDGKTAPRGIESKNRD